MALHADDGWQLRIVGAAQGVLHLNSFSFRQDGEHSDPPQALYEDFRDNLLDDYLACFLDSFVVNAIEVHPLWSVHAQPEPAPLIAAVASSPGTRDRFSYGDMAPWLCMLWRQHSDRGGRRFHSRVFVSNLSEGDVASQTIVSGTGGALDTSVAFCNAFVARYVGEPSSWGTMHAVCHSPAAQKADTNGYVVSSADAVSANVVTMAPSSVLTSNRGRRI